MTLSQHHLSVDHELLRQALCANDDFLIIQDLDGVCMGLVADPLHREIELDYLLAAKSLESRFYVLTNGEHIGTRGVNALVKSALCDNNHGEDAEVYLPGLAAGGVQFQDCRGEVSHPGVADSELAFLSRVPERMRAYLSRNLAKPPFCLNPETIEPLVQSAVLDNAVSPTINLNVLYQSPRISLEAFEHLQRSVEAYMTQLLDHARSEGLDDSFFVHLAPNLGSSDNEIGERLKPASQTDAGTTDFQFMLKGAIKEAGVLVLLNHYYFRKTGSYPLGESFNARQAPNGLDALVSFALEHFDPALMPRIMGVGDTITSSAQGVGPDSEQCRGGSDRGFLTLVQELGEAFSSDNVVVFVDSSGGEIPRPGVQAAERAGRQNSLNFEDLEGITDPDDTLAVNFVFPGGHRQYTEFFKLLALQTEPATNSPVHFTG